MHKHPYKIAAMMCALNEEEYIEYAMKQVIDVVNDVIVVLGKKPWNWQQYNTPFEYDRTEKIVRKLAKKHDNIHILWAPDPVSDGTNTAKAHQNAHRQHAIDKIKQLYPDEEYRYCFWLDADEFYTEQGLNTLLQTVSYYRAIYNSFSVPFRFYWRSFRYQLVLEKPIRRVNRIFRIFDDTHYRIGKYNKISSVEPNYEMAPGQVLCHHMTTCRAEESMHFKILTRAYAENRVPQLTSWYENIFLKWADHREMRNLHPTSPGAYKKAVRLDLSKEDFPTVLKTHPYYKMEVIK